MKLVGGIFVICFIAVISAAALDLDTLGNVVKTYKQLHGDPNDQGTMVDCGKAEGGSDFTLTWSPSVLAPNKKYVIKMNGQASVDFVSGNANVTVWIPGYGPPIYASDKKVTCAEAMPFTKGMLKCPIHKGDKINVPGYTIAAPESVSQVPPGTYVVQLRLTNDAGKLFVCAKGTITVGG